MVFTDGAFEKRLVLHKVTNVGPPIFNSGGFIQKGRDPTGRTHTHSLTNAMCCAKHT